MGLASSRRFRTTCPWPCAGWGSIGPYGDPVHEYGLDALGRSRRIVAVREIEHTIGVKDREAEKLSGVTLPAGSAFHTLRHSHAMWRPRIRGCRHCRLGR